MLSDFPTITAVPDIRLAEADRRYLARDWTAALALYSEIEARDPGHGRELALPIGIGHCRIELAAAAALSLDPGPCPESSRATVFITTARHRALELCSIGDAARAAQLLRFLGGFDGALSHVYLENIDRGRTPSADRLGLQAADVEPAFLADTGLNDDAVTAAKQRHRGRRVLVAGRIYRTRRYEVLDNLVRSSERFGLVLARFDTHAPGRDADTYAGALLASILEFKPDILYYADLLEFDVGAFSPDYAAQIADVLTLARRTLGVRVVRYLTDAWRTAALVGGDLFAGFGSFVDLLVHQYPSVLDMGTAQQRAAVFCFPSPTHLAVSTVEQGTVPRACFTGRIHEWAYTRAVWWAESARLGMPIDWQIQLPWDTARVIDPPASDQDYADRLRGYALSLSLVTRLNGARIMPQRAVETLLCGGVLLQETSSDTAYYLQPGRHFATFETLADLQALIPALLADRPRRLALADEGQRWATKYFTGDYFWAGLLDKLAALG